MKRFGVLLTGVLAAAVVVGCKSDKKDDTAANADNKYKILSGSTAENSHGKDPTQVGPEPELNAHTRFAAGRLAESQEKFDCAIIQYEQALRLDPNNVPSLYRLGVVQTKMKSYDTAAETWKRYVKATKGIPSAYSNLGFCYEMAGDTSQAEAAYKQGIERDSKNEVCRVNYGLMLARQNRVDEAQEQLAAVLKPDEVSYNLAAIFEQQGAYAQAREQLQHALQVNPNNKAAQQKLASLPASDPNQVQAPTEEMKGTQNIQEAPKPADEVKAPTETIPGPQD